MELPKTFVTQKNTPEIIAPDAVRGLSLGAVTEQFGTAGLYVRTIDTLERTGFSDNPMVLDALQLGLALHSDDFRTNGHYSDHLMRVMLLMIEKFGIRDPNLVAAAPLHDTLEDHPKDLVFTLTGERIADRESALRIGHEVIAQLTCDDVADIVEAVTNPPVREGEDKLTVYTDHTLSLVTNSPKGRVLKLADFIDNAGGNHATMGPKQLSLDKKYIHQFRTHRMGLFLPGGLISGEHREMALHMLSKGHTRALARLATAAAHQESSQREDSTESTRQAVAVG